MAKKASKQIYIIIKPSSWPTILKFYLPIVYNKSIQISKKNSKLKL